MSDSKLIDYVWAVGYFDDHFPHFFFFLQFAEQTVSWGEQSAAAAHMLLYQH